MREIAHALHEALSFQMSRDASVEVRAMIVVRQREEAWSLVASAALAGLGTLISTYLALYQYGFVVNVWDPLFGDGSARVLHAGLLDPLSRALGVPLHDAAVGAVGYAIEGVLAWKLGRAKLTASRRLLPLYALLVVLLGLTSLLLVVLQATWIGAWCTLCLASALISAAVVLLSRQELHVTINTLSRSIDRRRKVHHAKAS